MELNSDLFLSLNNNCVKRRVKREVETLYKTFKDITITIDSSNAIKITICDIRENKKYIYGFIINEHYPFRSPKIYYQNKAYGDYLRTNYSKHFFEIFRKQTGKECFCCSSYTCANNWTPAITMHKIIDEIDRVREAKRNVINKIMADKIKAKYLIDDVELDCWLF
jgi:ubiquitin-protein ligase